MNVKYVILQRVKDKIMISISSHYVILKILLTQKKRNMHVRNVIVNICVTRVYGGTVKHVL